MTKFLRRAVSGLLAVAALLLMTSGYAYADTSETSAYGEGDYGSCDYGTCGLTLTSGGATNINIIPSSVGTCTVQSDTVSVQTGNSNGYTVTITTSTSDNQLAGDGGGIDAASATAASPAVLSMNTWGYRVDGQAGFGSGPTSAQSSGSVPGVTFAGVPTSSQAGSIVTSSNDAAEVAVDTEVWYGACADATTLAGNYSTTVLYTAVAN